MKIIVIAFCLLIFIPTAFSQPIQKYVVDGKTYYGQPPAGLSLGVDVENVRIDNTYVDEEDYRLGVGRKKEYEVSPDKTNGNRMPGVEPQKTSNVTRQNPQNTSDQGMDYNERKQAEAKKRSEAKSKHHLRMEKLRCSSPRRWDGERCR